MIERYIDMSIIIDIVIFLVFPVSVFIWYKYYGEEYSIEEKVSCKELLMYGYCLDINHLIERNSPYFWYCFQKVYPDFCAGLLEENPSLSISELKLCAYIYQGYKSCEIAEYTNMPMTSVKHNLFVVENKLKLLPGENLQTWLRNYYATE
ncbi:hypothetical protein [Elizabethkingia anophelis]|uniref:hypothetical protein n=1 Tax=Elizabethkingia anophelis TaxID=1117645 RepID=UPI003F1C552F